MEWSIEIPWNVVWEYITSIDPVLCIKAGVFFTLGLVVTQYTNH